MSEIIRRQVVDANQRFYDAMESLDVAEMDDVWERTDRVACVHPGGTWLTGYVDVRRSLSEILEATPSIEFEVSGVEVRLDDPVAIVTCTERVTGPDGQPAELAATNVFVLGLEGWRMILHHASPVMRPG